MASSLLTAFNETRQISDWNDIDIYWLLGYTVITFKPGLSISPAVLFTKVATGWKFRCLFEESGSQPLESWKQASAVTLMFQVVRPTSWGIIANRIPRRLDAASRHLMRVLGLTFLVQVTRATPRPCAGCKGCLCAYEPETLL